jgi:hypothetical protein
VSHYPQLPFWCSRQRVYNTIEYREYLLKLANIGGDIVIITITITITIINKLVRCRE